MKTSKQRYLFISSAVAAVAATLSMGAHAEYRCATPAQLDMGEIRACELAKSNRPDDLRLFIQRTAPIYGLYFYDYVSQKDDARWASAREHKDAQSITKAGARSKEQSRS